MEDIRKTSRRRLGLCQSSPVHPRSGILNLSRVEFCILNRYGKISRKTPNDEMVQGVASRSGLRRRIRNSSIFFVGVYILSPPLSLSFFFLSLSSSRFRPRSCRRNSANRCSQPPICRTRRVIYGYASSPPRFSLSPLTSRRVHLSSFRCSLSPPPSPPPVPPYVPRRSSAKATRSRLRVT